MALIGLDMASIHWLHQPSWLVNSRRNISPSHQSGPGECMNTMIMHQSCLLPLLVLCGPLVGIMIVPG